ncbi:hypothetical protein [Streptomyces coeruleorubidus]|uniref:hypothetical protein n=1 Tax=Streptomyces coeruleorubidus TaxID=116188 RepID=UPI0036493CD3
MISMRLRTAVCVLSKPQLSPTRERPTTLYRVIGAASLPDVDSGYFIHSPATAAEHFREYGPTPIDGEPIALVFASDGGGHLFAIGASGQVRKSTTASWFDDFEVTRCGDTPEQGAANFKGRHQRAQSSRWF